VHFLFLSFRRKNLASPCSDLFNNLSLSLFVGLLSFFGVSMLAALSSLQQVNPSESFRGLHRLRHLCSWIFHGGGDYARTPSCEIALR